MKPDLLVVWPDVIDYPLFREWIHKYRDKFNKVLIVWSQTNWDFPSVVSFVEKEMYWDDPTFIQCAQVEPGADWRNIAVRTGLEYVESDWIWFTEQDFFPNPNLWAEMELLPTKCDVVSVKQDGRMHPCCILIKKEVLDKTTKDFSASPPEHDHFGQLQKDLMNWNPPLVDCTINPRFYKHMNGLTHNVFLLMKGEKPNYNIPEFKRYCTLCLNAKIEVYPNMRKLFEKYLK